jgi:hypothetical protein
VDAEPDPLQHPETGGHFAVWEQPALQAKEIRDCFAKVRRPWPRQARIGGAVTVKRKEESHD